MCPLCGPACVNSAGHVCVCVSGPQLGVPVLAQAPVEVVALIDAMQSLAMADALIEAVAERFMAAPTASWSDVHDAGVPGRDVARLRQWMRDQAWLDRHAAPSPLSPQCEYVLDGHCISVDAPLLMCWGRGYGYGCGAARRQGRTDLRIAAKALDTSETISYTGQSVTAGATPAGLPPTVRVVVSMPIVPRWSSGVCCHGYFLLPLNLVSSADWCI